MARKIVWSFEATSDLEESRVVILGIIHGKRDLKSLWEKEQRGN